MPLVNFGSILSFAEEIETQQLEIYNQVLALPHCAEMKKDIQALAKAAQKRISEVRRVRRENVTEMILETIEGFSREPFLMKTPDAAAMTTEEITPLILHMGDRAMDFYDKAALKLKGQAEVARALKGLKKKHAKDKGIIS